MSEQNSRVERTVAGGKGDVAMQPEAEVPAPWDEPSRRVSNFVTRFLAMALGATNKPKQRVVLEQELGRTFYLGKLVPQSITEGGSDYKTKIAPCSYVASFLLKGTPSKVRLQLTPSFNVYFHTAIRKQPTRATQHAAPNKKAQAQGGEDGEILEQADESALALYSVQADPALPATGGRADMWVPWQDRRRVVPPEYTAELASLVAGSDTSGNLFGKYSRRAAMPAYIRKRYCTALEVEVECPPTGSSIEAEVTVPLDLPAFRKAYEKLGASAEWKGEIVVKASIEAEDPELYSASGANNEDAAGDSNSANGSGSKASTKFNTRITIQLTNTAGVAGEKRQSRFIHDASWFDTHLAAKLLEGAEVQPVPCPILHRERDSEEKVPLVYAEARNCALILGDEDKPAPGRLVFGPVARTRTTRRVAREVPFTFSEGSSKPRELLATLLSGLRQYGAAEIRLRLYEEDVNVILRDSKALAAIGMASEVYAKAINLEGKWRFHQLAALVRTAATYLRREAGTQMPPRPLVLNVPTAGGKTEAFFGGMLFCAFYEALRKGRSVSIIKYPVTLLSSDQIARLSRYSMVADELAVRAGCQPLGIAYMVGGKGKYDTPQDVIAQCPYPSGVDGAPCGKAWASFKVNSGMPTLSCGMGHKLHLGIDKGQMLTQQSPAFIIATWDKFVAQSMQRRLALLFGSRAYRCPKHGVVDFADTNQYFSLYQPKAKAPSNAGQPQPQRPQQPTLPSAALCQCYDESGKRTCGMKVEECSPAVPGLLVFDEGHLIRESQGTLDSHFETMYLQIAQDLCGKQPLPVVSTATIAGIYEFIQQLGLEGPGGPDDFTILPASEESTVFFEDVKGEMQHEVLAVMPFDVVLTWALPDLLDIFFETLAEDFGYDPAVEGSLLAAGLEHLRQIMLYCSSYKNINMLKEMVKNTTNKRRQRRKRPALKSITLSSRDFDRTSAAKSIERVKKVEQQIVYATNIASIGIDIDNLDVVFFYGLPANVSEFIQAMNRTGRKKGKPAICIAVLGPTHEREISYYRYWSQFVKTAHMIVEPVPLNRFASSAITRTFNNMATSTILMSYVQRKRRKLFYSANIRTSISQQPGALLPEAEVVSKLKRIYRVSLDPTGEYEERVEQLWSQYKEILKADTSNSFVKDAFGQNYMWNLRAKQREIAVEYADAVEVIERYAGGGRFTGDIDSDSVAEVEPESSAGVDEEAGQPEK